ncbi:hypothetical protein CRE_21510 [Caenorhabditis remanei]|uniref:Uncharacterized protein n=1 Tax=Caenorhabditis remanei TaxID=31234 RepID=E3N8Y6_CAERE|nr:hypothetical protein CRE_21510 [Caenorhabditis remanei]
MLSRDHCKPFEKEGGLSGRTSSFKLTKELLILQAEENSRLEEKVESSKKD